MKLLAKVRTADLAAMQRLGATPNQAVDALLAEAKARYPQYECVIMQRDTIGEGFDIIAVR